MIWTLLALTAAFGFVCWVGFLLVGRAIFANLAEELKAKEESDGQRS